MVGYREPFPDSKVHGAYMGPSWVLSAPNGPHVCPSNLAIRVSMDYITKIKPYTSCVWISPACDSLVSKRPRIYTCDFFFPHRNRYMDNVIRQSNPLQNQLSMVWTDIILPVNNSLLFASFTYYVNFTMISNYMFDLPDPVYNSPFGRYAHGTSEK